MSRKISFAGKELDAVLRATELLYDRSKESKEDAKYLRALDSLLKKMQAACAPVEKPEPGLGWVRFEAIMREELGKKYAPAHVNIPLTATRIRDAGITEDDLKYVCSYLRRQTHPMFSSISPTWLIVRWAEMLHRAKQADGLAGKEANGRRGGPLEIE